MTLGPTHYSWRPDVQRVVRLIHARFPQTRCNTYVGHPWSGWDGRSLDVWGPGGRGDPISEDLGHRVLRFVFNLEGDPQIRHYIYLNTLWTSFGGTSRWASSDHSGNLRHLHVTYW